MRRTRGWLAALAVFAVVIAVVVAYAVHSASRALHVEPAPAVAAAADPLRPAGAAGGPDADGAAGYAGRVRRAMDALVASRAMGDTHGVVADAATGRVLWSSGAADRVTPASTMKILTAAAALLELGPEARVTTRVHAAAEPGRVVLVGGGDPTLSAAGEGFYPGAASMAELARRVRAAAGEIDAVVVDQSGNVDAFHPDWEAAGIAEGYIAPVETVEVDAGRGGPEDVTARSATPALDAGRLLAEELGAGAVRAAAVDPGDLGEVLGEVDSAPLAVRLRQMMQHSDNVLAESIAREVARARGERPTFAGSTAAVAAVLVEHGLLDPAEIAAEDCSGLSEGNRVAPEAINRVLLAAAGDPDAVDPAAGADPEGIAARLSPLIDALPVAAVSGTLADRYGGAGGAGWVRAKTGTLSRTSALAGVAPAAGGRLLAFTLISNGVEVTAARAAADAGVSRLLGIE